LRQMIRPRRTDHLPKREAHALAVIVGLMGGFSNA
jgi:hypothetical protein